MAQLPPVPNLEALVWDAGEKVLKIPSNTAKLWGSAEQ